jgi:hypothetical protein
MADVAVSAQRREDLNGCWVLDPKKGSPSMRQFLEVMGVDELAIQANEKGESEHPTFQTITLSDKAIKIIKRSRVNNDVVVDLTLGEVEIEYLSPGQREKRVLATSLSPQHIQIESSLLTVNGLAKVMEVKKLINEEDTSLLQQELTITNAATGQTHTTVRYFIPYIDTPPHLEDLLVADEAVPT